MLDIRTILVPTDLSERSERALEHAAALAEHFGAKLLCLHVIPPAPNEYQLLGKGTAPELSSENVREVERRLHTLVRSAVPGGEVETLVIAGEPAHRIEKLAQERNVGLIVMPTRGHGRFRRMLLGSVVAKVLHDVECPVMTGVHFDEEPVFRGAPYKTVACALGLRNLAHSGKILRWAAELARSWQASLHLIHVPPSIDWSAGEWFPDETQQLVKEASREKLEALMTDVGCEARMHTDGLEAAPYTAEVVREVGADVLVVGRSAEHGLLGGGDAFAIIRQSPCPVISV